MDRNFRPPPSIRVLQIITAAMAMGLLAISAVGLVMAPNATPGANDPLLFAIVLAGLGFAQCVAFVVLRMTTIAATRQSIDPTAADLRLDAFLARFATLALVGLAMAEGWGLFGAVLVIVTGNLYFLAVPALAIFALLAQFPTQGKLQRFAQAVTGRLIDE